MASGLLVVGGAKPLPWHASLPRGLSVVKIHVETKMTRVTSRVCSEDAYVPIHWAVASQKDAPEGMKL